MAYRLTKKALEDLLDSYGLTIGNLNLLPTERNVKRLFWRDNMEDYTTLKWPYMSAGTVLSYSSEIPAFEGDYVLRMLNPAARWASCHVFFGPLPNVKNGVELAWYKDANLNMFRVGLTIFNNGAERRISIQWRRPTSRWEHINSDGERVAVPGGEEAIDDGTWNTVRLIGDWGNNRYSKLVTTSLDIDMSTLPLYEASSTWNRTELRLGRDMAHFNQPFYCDDVRLYVNEV